MGVFTNRESVERIVFAVFHHLNVNWENTPLNEFTHKDRHYLIDLIDNCIDLFDKKCLSLHFKIFGKKGGF